MTVPERGGQPHEDPLESEPKHAREPDSLPRPGHRLGKYKLIEQIGKGGTGLVYLAEDLERRGKVALKTLHKLEPKSIELLKQEFRAVQDIEHDNLATLFEMMVEDGQWFFTMEHVDGENLRSYLKRNKDQKSGSSRSSEASPSDAVNTTATLQPSGGGHSKPTDSEPERFDSQGYWHKPALEVEELRTIFIQLARGIRALHEADHLHRDIKPENIMVAKNGRVVLLDFGLASRLRPVIGESSGGQIVGTPNYISPEHAAGKEPTPASDWYAFGIVLYEALTGRAPFVGARSRVLKDKQRADAPPLPLDLKIPNDLRNLCTALLLRDPSRRPSATDVLVGLGDKVAASETPSSAGRHPPLIGRARELRMLEDAYALLGKPGDRTVVVHVYGSSGVGKTALVERFLAQTSAKTEKGKAKRVTIFRGRCYERETVPYKAFDSLIDALARRVRELDPVKRSEVLPEEARELVRLFPALRFGKVSQEASIEPDPQNVRRRAVQSLKDMLRQLALGSNLVLFIDDLQWSDAASIVLLNELIAPLSVVPMLLICSHRSDSQPKLVAEHMSLKAMVGDTLEVAHLAVGSLEPEYSVKLMRHLLSGPHGKAETLSATELERLVNESRGIPFFIEELARGSSTGGDVRSADGGASSFERVVMARVDKLTPSARNLLNVVAVAGRPVPQSVAALAAEATDCLSTDLIKLRNEHLTSGLGFRGEDTIESYHDRIRESVAASLPNATAKRIHLKLANAFEAARDPDPVVLAEHYFAAEVWDKAAVFAVEAGNRAERALAFDSAANMFGRALECIPGDRSLLEKRAQALVNAGRSAEAAPVYLEAAGHEPDELDPTYLDLRRHAAEQFLASGRITEGIDVLRPLLSAAGLKYPSSPKLALMGIIARSIQMDIGGYEPKRRAQDGVSDEDRRRIDLCWAAGKGLGSVDIMRGGYFIVRSTQLALKSGDRDQVVRGLAHVGLFTAAQGGKSIAKGTGLIEKARKLAGPEDVYLDGFANVNEGTARMTLGEWKEAYDKLSKGTKTLEEKCTGVAWECSFAHSVSVNVLRFLGNLRDLGTLGSKWLRTADACGDLYGAVWLRLHTSAVLLAGGNEAAARESIATAMKNWSPLVFTPQELVAAFLETECDLYSGDAEAAYNRINKAWKDAAGSFALGWKNNQVQALHARGAAALSFAETQPERRAKLLREVASDVKELANVGIAYGNASSKLLAAGLANTQGRRDEALALLDEASSLFDQGNMEIHEAVARRCRGKLLGGAEGESLIVKGDDVLKNQGVADIERWTRMHAPGFGAASQ